MLGSLFMWDYERERHKYHATSITQRIKAASALGLHFLGGRRWASQFLSLIRYVQRWHRRRRSKLTYTNILQRRTALHKWLVWSVHFALLVG